MAERDGMRKVVQDQPLEAELAAINTIVQSLEKLGESAQNRVLDYALKRLGLSQPALSHSDQEPAEADLISSLQKVRHEPEKSSGSVTDVRSFAESKQPTSANEKAAVIAYYLAELASPAERRASINQDDVTKFFKQARFPLPASPAMTLVHAKNAGYFESESPGQYRLNAVGYNLVAHRLPYESDSKAGAKKRSSRKASRRRGTAKKSKKASR